jgi:hypothetical protein
MKKGKLAYILRSEGLLPRVAGIGSAVPEGEVDFGRPFRAPGRPPMPGWNWADYTSAHFRVGTEIYMELESDHGAPTLFGSIRFDSHVDGLLSPREVAEELQEELEDSTMPVMFEGQRWKT